MLVFSISVITAFEKAYKYERQNHKKPHNDGVIDNNVPCEVKDELGLTILEALSATGLRSIRYAKEIPGVKQIIANDISKKAFEDIQINIRDNNVDDIVTANLEDAT